ncbi:response regulator [Paenibacillus sp. OSY-SE]|uniref:response regulator n=1 Tax=Paenibacillus sp. OSY-SE TaxID=1196323 RepID=UPI0002E1BDDF|nr:response regulator [Paenibacillus sp. OSY-SE]
MYKVLIVDDESIVRIAMKTMIPWEANQFQLLGTAENGRAAMAVIQEEEPDIVITDLKMPEMDGLELIQNIKEQAHRCRIIVLSNYGEYEMVREAMKLGAEDYLLKVTLQSDDLLELMRTVSERIEKERERERENVQLRVALKEKESRTRNELWKEWLTDRDAAQNEAAWVKKAERAGIGQHLKQCAMLHITVDRYEQAITAGKIKDRHLLRFSIQNFVSDVLSEYKHYEWIELNNKDFVVLLAEDGYTRALIPTLARHIQKTLHMYLNVNVTVVYTDTFSAFPNWRGEWQRCRHTGELVFYMEDSESLEDIPCLQAEEMEAVQRETSESKAMTSAKMVECGSGGDWATLTASVDYLLDEAIINRMPPNELKRLAVDVMREMKLDMSLENEQLLARMQQSESCYQLRDNWYRAISALAEARNNDLARQRPEIRDAILFMKRNYQHKITLGMIASEVKMNESYLSRLFKQETGLNMMQYLTDIRMEKAKVLLKDPQAKVKEVAAIVGIEDPFYFNRLFRKTFGESPSHFKEKMSRNSIVPVE